MKYIMLTVALIYIMPAFSQVTITGYAEVYYSYDFAKPIDNNKRGYIYSHNRHNEFDLNLGFVNVAYTAENVRAKIALAAGTYMNANYAAEPGVLKNVYEANAGIKLSKNKNLWLDAGIFASHIGFESAISKDCPTLTRSILAENSPYYESGAKLTYTSNDSKWLISVLALNGWQRIKRIDGNSLMSWGTQIQFKPNTTTTLNYSTFIGTDKPDSLRQMRYFHNIYAIFNLTGKLAATAGFDIGTEENNTWYSPILILKYSLNNKYAIAARGEYYKDAAGVIIASDTKLTGFSINLDYAPVANTLIRIEGKRLDHNTILTSSIAINF